jgi:hypothetical protein
MVAPKPGLTQVYQISKKEQLFVTKPIGPYEPTLNMNNNDQEAGNSSNNNNVQFDPDPHLAVKPLASKA